MLMIAGVLALRRKEPAMAGAGSDDRGGRQERVARLHAGGIREAVKAIAASNPAWTG
jgi:hypothetical protein